MRPYSLLICLFIAVLLTGVAACKKDKDPQPVVCRLTSVTDQVIGATGSLTDEMQRTFTYGSDGLASITERSQSQNATFQVDYTDKHPIRASAGSALITLSYPSATTAPGSATFTQGQNVQSTFTMEYTPAGKLSRIVERRQVVPANSQTVERAYTFTYDNAGNLTLERGRFNFRDGTVVQQETEYVADTKPSPYTHFTERSLLTVIALSQAVEAMPGRFWHLNAPLSYKSYFLTSTGSRGPVSESSTFTPTYDADSKLMSQDQTALLYQSSVQPPLTKKNRQAFAYTCD